jgi:hypothetical protein
MARVSDERRAPGEPEAVAGRAEEDEFEGAALKAASATRSVSRAMATSAIDRFESDIRPLTVTVRATIHSTPLAMATP